MRHFSYEKTEGKYCLFVKLLSFRSPFEYMSELETSVARRVKNGLIIVDEAEHNDDPEKRYIGVEVRDGKLIEETIHFVLDYESSEDAELEENYRIY